jgi:hypothetical protein
MTTLTLRVKTSHGWQLKQIDELLKSEFEELDVELKVLGNTINRWVQVELSGEDQAIATSFVKNKIGTCPVNLENAKELGTLKGYISKVDGNKNEIRVDVGILQPRVIQVTLSLKTLQDQLLKGENLDLKKLSEYLALVEGLPIEVKLAATNGEEELLAELSAKEIQRLNSWQMSLLDRLIIFGTTKESIEMVLERTKLNRDIIDIEDFGLFVHALTCKLGTDAAGLIPKIGRYMRYSIFALFRAKRFLDMINKN